MRLSRERRAGKAIDERDAASSNGRDVFALLRTGPLRLTRIDGLRGLAATIVVCAHYKEFFFARGLPLKSLENFPLRRILFPFYLHGSYAVDFFWLLSGVVFFHTYAPKAVTLGDFFWRRIARLYPLHFVTLFIMVVLNFLWLTLFAVPAGENNDLFHFGLQLFIATDWFRAFGQSFNYPIWSVSMEVLAYAVFFLFLRFTSRGWQIHLTIVCITLAAALGLASYKATAVALFFIGCSIARWGRSVPVWLTAVGAIGALLFVFAVGVSQVSRHIGLAVEYTLFPAILLGVFKIDLARPPLRHELMGDLSYGIYLCHVPVITALRLVIAGTGVNPASRPWFLLMTLALVMGIAWMSFRWLERPAQEAILVWRGLRKRRSDTSADHYVEIEASAKV